MPFSFFRKLFSRRKVAPKNSGPNFSNLDEYLAYKKSIGLDGERRNPTQQPKPASTQKPTHPSSQEQSPQNIGKVIQPKNHPQQKPQPKNIKPGF
jgi:hypothetical protein